MVAFRTLENWQLNHLADSFTGVTEKDKRGPDLPSRMKASLRRIAVLARANPRGRGEAGLPRLDGVLVPAGDWKPIVSGILVHTLKGRDGYVPVIVEGELDTRRPLSIRVEPVRLRVP